MSEAKLIRPEYSEGFRCIGPACEDTCCKGWAIPIDQEAYEKFRNVPASPLRTLIQISFLVTPKEAARRDGSGQPVSRSAIFATIRMTPSNYCPLLSDDGLCRIQTELGATFLPSTCGNYPRIVHSIDAIEEQAFALSCPEAARVVLLNPNFLGAESLARQLASSHFVPNQGPPAGAIDQPLHATESSGKAGIFRSWFWLIRESVLALVRNRSYPLWQRLFLLGILCRRLDSIAKGELELSVPTFLREFEASIASGTLRTAMDSMETLPADSTLQLDMVLRLAGMALKDSRVHPRFIQCVEAFKVGIGNGPGATLESLTSHYTEVHDQFYAPFFDRHPYILENYLINLIVRSQFPLRQGMQPGASPSMAREYALLTAQFALMKGLLIGVAGCHGEAFSTDHVVHTVQSASRHFEHHPDFLSQAHTLLVESQMDGARGLAILLRNTEATASKAAPADLNERFPRRKAS